MNKYFSFAIVAALFLAVFFLVWNTWRVIRPANIKAVEIGGSVIALDVVQSPETRQEGLSGRAELREDEGMLFVFDTLGKYSFWMKDMNFPIDIIWMDGLRRIVYIKENAKPENFPETYTPDRNALYVLEVNAGIVEKNNLKVGDKIEFWY